jgi:transcriptional regulator with XRE-family HTH domain
MSSVLLPRIPNLQKEFADRCGVHRSYMGTIERSEYNFSLGTLRKVSGALEISVSTLLNGII